MSKELIVDHKTSEQLKRDSRDWPSWDLSPHQTCDLELMLNGAFAPLDRFMSETEVQSVESELRLPNGTFWPTPICLEVTDDFASSIRTGSKVALRDPEGVMLSFLEVDEIWSRKNGSSSVQCLAGNIVGIELPEHHDYRSLRHTPSQLQDEFARRGWRRIVGFQTTEPIHRAEFEMTKQLALEHQANLLIQPIVGFTQPGARDHFGRVRCYQALLPHYPAGLAQLSLLPLAERSYHEKGVLLQAIALRNFGCTHMIAPPDPEATQLLEEHKVILNLEILPYKSLAYQSDTDEFSETAGTHSVKQLTDEELHARLAGGRDIPEWFTFADVATELRKIYPPRSNQGFTVFFTGLSGSGKSTAAKALLSKFLEIGGRSVTLLDGDIVRKNLSSELGFSKEHRNLNILRIGFVANQITKNGGIAICAPIAPYDEIRKQVRSLITNSGGFILVHLSTPLEVCETRDRKGLYAKARAGVLKEFTGISDPYETPADADVTLNTDQLNVEECCQKILLHLEQQGFIGPSHA